MATRSLLAKVRAKMARKQVQLRTHGSKFCSILRIKSEFSKKIEHLFESVLILCNKSQSKFLNFQCGPLEILKNIFVRRKFVEKVFKICLKFCHTLPKAETLVLKRKIGTFLRTVTQPPNIFKQQSPGNIKLDFYFCHGVF